MQTTHSDFFSSHCSGGAVGSTGLGSSSKGALGSGAAGTSASAVLSSSATTGRRSEHQESCPSPTHPARMGMAESRCEAGALINKKADETSSTVQPKLCQRPLPLAHQPCMAPLPKRRHLAPQISPFKAQVPTESVKEFGGGKELGVPGIVLATARIS